MIRQDEKEKALSWIERINQHTRPGSGITRPSYSLEETGAMRVVLDWALDRAGLTTSWDIAGNLHVVFDGTLPGRAIVVGSHLDSVPSGGRFDGVAGVVAAMLVIERLLWAHSDASRSVRLIVLRGEESAWFGQCYLGSRALFGKLPSAALTLKRSDNDEPLFLAMTDCWAVPALVAEGQRALDPEQVACFYEVHIEQGPVLVEEGLPIAIVSGIRGNTRFMKAIARGEAGHSGTVPLSGRSDAVLAFANFLTDCMAEAHYIQRARGDFVLTSGVVHTNATRNAVSIIADEVTFALEFRSRQNETLREAEDIVRHHADEHRIDLGEVKRTPPVTLDEGIGQHLIEMACRFAEEYEIGHPVRVLASGAGHDAAVFQDEGIPTGMIFVRNDHGSHNPHESMEIDDLLIAVDVLHLAILNHPKETETR